MIPLNRHILPPILAALSSAMILTLWACAPATTVDTPALYGAALEPAVNLPQLTFTRTDGGSFSTADTRDRISLFFFGYTHCADVCPLTLSQFVQLRRALGRDGAAVDLYFVTVDPARDTLDWMRTYVANFPGVVGLIGSDAEVESAENAFNIVAERRELGHADYAVDHTAAIYLVDSTGKIDLAYTLGTPTEDIVSDLRRLVVAPGWPSLRAAGPDALGN